MRICVLFALCTVAGAATIPPIPKITARDFGPGFEPASLTNGMIGVRPGPNPLVSTSRWPRESRAGYHPLATVVAGFVRSKPLRRSASLAPAPYPLSTDIRANGMSLQANDASVRVRSQTLDMTNGEMTTEMSFSPTPDLTLDITVLQFASRSTPALLVQEIAITPSRNATFEILTDIDRTNIPGSVYVDKAPYQEKDTDRVLGFRNDRNKLGIALTTKYDSGISRKAIGEYVADTKAGTTYHFYTFAAMVSEAYHPDPDLQAIRLARWGELIGFQRLRDENRTAWTDVWKGRVKVYGDAEAQKALDVAYFNLHSNANPSSLSGVPPFGWSQFEAYDGRIFWDMDSWMFPPALLSYPETARAMLEFRVRGIPAAREKAATFGYRGLQFPWEAAYDGSEGGPSGAATSWAEQHTTPDIAIAFWEYYLATFDNNFLRESAWPVLKGVAEWITSRGQFTGRGFEISHVMGVDESLDNIDNGSHMNLACKMALDAAVRCARHLGYSVSSEWQRAADRMVVPFSSDKRIIIPYDGAKAGPGYSVGMLHFLLLHNIPVDDDVLRNTIRFEEDLRLRIPATPSNPCSKEAPGFTCPAFASAAAWMGDRKLARELFVQSWKPYWVEPYGLSKEYSKYLDGNYLTNHGSLLMAAMLGFTGLRMNEGDWRKYPACLPEGWDKIEVDRIYVKGKPMKLAAVHGKPAELSPTE